MTQDLIENMRSAAPTAAAFLMSPEHYKDWVRAWLATEPSLRERVPTTFEWVPVVVCRYYDRSYVLTNDNPPNLILLAI